MRGAVVRACDSGSGARMDVNEEAGDAAVRWVHQSNQAGAYKLNLSGPLLVARRARRFVHAEGKGRPGRDQAEEESPAGELVDRAEDAKTSATNFARIGHCRRSTKARQTR